MSDNGQNIIECAAAARKASMPEEKVKKPAVQHRYRSITSLPQSVQQWPEFPGGGPAFMSYIDQLGKELIEFLPTGIKKLYIQVEFIVDKDGVPTNFKVLKGTQDDDLVDELIDRMEKMPVWQPALLNDKPVPKKMIQTVTISVD
jgi:hypothetical protein